MAKRLIRHPLAQGMLARLVALYLRLVWATTRWNLPYIAVLVAVLFLVTYVPPVSLFLVDYFYR